MCVLPIAATLLPGGVTSHSLFALPLNCNEEGVISTMKAQEPRAEILRMASLILWDEASMIPKGAASAADSLLRDLTGIDAPFGGKTILFGGDFRQVLAVRHDP